MSTQIVPKAQTGASQKGRKAKLVEEAEGMDDAKYKRNALPIVQGDDRCETDKAGGRALHQVKRVLQPAHIQDKGDSPDGAKTKEVTIRWNEWNPFQRATGRALQQLNKRIRKQKELDDAPEALL